MQKNFLISLIICVFSLTAYSQEYSKQIKVISVEQLNKKIKKPIQLVDVRTAGEYNAGKIAAAVNIDVLSSEFDAKVSTLNKRKPIYVYCRSGKRSASAAKKLAELGFKKIRDVDGGYLKWQSIQSASK